MLREYDRNITVVVTEANLTIDSLVIVFELYLVGISANETLQEFLSEINSSTEGLNIGIGDLKVCYQNCYSSDSDNDNQDRVSFSVLLLSVLIVVAVIFTVIFTILSLLACYIRYVQVSKR